MFGTPLQMVLSRLNGNGIRDLKCANKDRTNVKDTI